MKVIRVVSNIFEEVKAEVFIDDNTPLETLHRAQDYFNDEVDAWYKGDDDPENPDYEECLTYALKKAGVKYERILPFEEWVV